jgi:hypothetical protein
MWGRAPSPVQAERELGKVRRSYVAFRRTAANGTAEAVPYRSPKAAPSSRYIDACVRVCFRPAPQSRFLHSGSGRNDNDRTAESRAFQSPVMHELVVPTLPKTGEGWGTLACGTSIEGKGVGQECPTYTSMSGSCHAELYLFSVNALALLGSPK